MQEFEAGQLLDKQVVWRTPRGKMEGQVVEVLNDDEVLCAVPFSEETATVSVVDIISVS